MDKETFKQNAKNGIDEIFDAIERVQERANVVGVEAKARFNETLFELREKKKDVQAKYDELESTSDEKWEEVKGAFSSAFDSFKEGLKKITSIIK
jgi:predicted nuclease with TOPRIM domain